MEAEKKEQQKLLLKKNLEKMKKNIEKQHKGMEMQMHMEAEVHGGEHMEKMEQEKKHFEMQMHGGEKGNVILELKKGVHPDNLDKMKNMIWIDKEKGHFNIKDVKSNIKIMKIPCADCKVKIEAAVKKHIAECEEGNEKICPSALEAIKKEVMEACPHCGGNGGNGDVEVNVEVKKEAGEENAEACADCEENCAEKEEDKVFIGEKKADATAPCADCKAKIEAAVKKHILECEDGKDEICPECLEPIKKEVMGACPDCKDKIMKKAEGKN